MTDKQIMIDNVDVSECEHAFVHTSLFKEKTLVQCSAFFLENEDSCCECSDNPNCYYKQLKRKEQECEELKKTLTEIRNVLEAYYDDDWRATREIEKILQKISEAISE